MSGEWGELMVWFIRLTLEVFGDLMTGVTGDLLMVMLGLCEFGVRPGVSEEDIRETAGAFLLEQMRGKTEDFPAEEHADGPEDEEVEKYLRV